MMSYKKVTNIAGWTVFAIAFIVYYLSAERTGSLWDCGEFIAGAYKLQVVHPPGAPLFLLIGRMFTFVAEIFSDNPENIAFSVNLLSGICTAFTAMFVSWVTIILGKLALVGREEEPDQSQILALGGAGLVAGLATTFCSSIWFSAVEGEVYAMSTFFTALTLWAVIKWYAIPKDDPKADRWIVFAIYSAALSIGVHLLSLLTFPALALFYYFKKYEKHSFLGMAAAAAIGVALIAFIQTIIIIGIPSLWKNLEIMMVNGFGLPQHSGIVPLVLIIGAIIGGGVWYAHKTHNGLLQQLVVAIGLAIIGFSTIGVVVIRANANTPINMNAPDDAARLLPYINREQYGERPLLKGPHFGAKHYKTEQKQRYGWVPEKGKYEKIYRKVTPVYKEEDKMLFPRMGDNTQSRPKLYRDEWMGGKSGPPTMADNISFFVRYQLGWMYWRYFMWNFAGRQNGEQGYTPANVKKGNWLSGINFIDEARLHNMSELPETMKNDQVRNKFFMLPVLFGIIGLIFHFRARPNDFLGLLAMFIITGIGIIIYSNQPPHEPRERDYVLAGSFFTFSIWIGMAVLALFRFMQQRNLGKISAPIAFALVLVAPILMGSQNFDDHTRRHHKGSRDYAANFLNSCEENAIIFTYGDNDTYPLWYAQEVEGIRTDVRVVNLSLIAVDWYIDQLRRKVNDSPPIKMTIDRASYRGYKRDQVYIEQENNKRMNALEALRVVNQDNSKLFNGQIEGYLPSNKLFLPVDKQKVLANGTVSPADTGKIVDRVEFNMSGNFMFKGDLAVLDIVASNVWDRPVYFAVTCRTQSLIGLGNHLQLEGLGLRVVPIKTDSKDKRIFGLVGFGRVDTETVYDNIMNKFRWGNFDKEELFVDKSYGPSIQSTQLLMLRTCQNLIDQGEKEKAANLAAKYFEAFPHMNFPYNYSSLSMMKVLIQADAYDQAKEHLKILAEETADHLEFYFSLDPDDVERGFSSDLAYADRTRQELMAIAKNAKDTEFESYLKDVFEGLALQEFEG